MWQGYANFFRKIKFFRQIHPRNNEKISHIEYHCNTIVRSLFKIGIINYGSPVYKEGGREFFEIVKNS